MTEISTERLEYHETASVFPMMNKEDFSALKNDIKANGLKEPIWVYEGKIIDGRNRYEACKELGIEPESQTWDGKDELLIEFVLSMNLHRRHLTSSQRAALAVDLEPMLARDAKKRQQEAGGDRKSEDYKESVKEKVSGSKSYGQARDEAARLTITNGNYVTKAKRIKRYSPELFEEVKTGKKTIPKAMRELPGKKFSIESEMTKIRATVERIEALIIELSVNDRQKLILDLMSNEEQFKIKRIEELLESGINIMEIDNELNEKGITAMDHKSSGTKK